MWKWFIWRAPETETKINTGRAQNHRHDTDFPEILLRNGKPGYKKLQEIPRKPGPHKEIINGPVDLHQYQAQEKQKQKLFHSAD